MAENTQFYLNNQQFNAATALSVLFKSSPKDVWDALRSLFPVDNETGRIGPWMQTFTGKRFYFIDPREEDFCIEDTAHALSKEPRFGGHHHGKDYSVAEHLVLGSAHVRQRYQYPYFMHDGPEAYIKDVPTPLKVLLPVYKAIEWGISECFWRAFKLDGDPLRIPEVKLMDRRMLATEHEQLCLQEGPGLWKVQEKPLGIKLDQWNAAKAEKMFLLTYKTLTT